MSLNLMQASRQWAVRPSDERFWGLHDLKDAMVASRNASQEREVYAGSIRAVSEDEDLKLQGPSGHNLSMTHWSFGQVASYAGAPANYLRSLPAPLAADCINNGLQGRNDRVNVLLRRNHDAGEIRSLTSEQYGRIWNSQVVDALLPALGNGWMVPPARPSVSDPRARPATEADILPNQGNFGLSVRVGDLIAPAGVYASDHDLFIFLVNPDRHIDDGGLGLMRGVFITNSEVGAGALKVTTFLLEHVCGNHIVWGASQVRNIKVIHRRGSRMHIGFRNGFAQLASYVNAGTAIEVEAINRARTQELGKDKDEVVEAVFGKRQVGLTKGDIQAAYDVAVKWEHTARAKANTVWGFVHGLTRYSQQRDFADERNRLDVAGGRLLALAAR